MLTDIDKYAIKSMMAEKLEAKDIAKKGGWPIKEVQLYLAELNPKNEMGRKELVPDRKLTDKDIIRNLKIAIAERDSEIKKLTEKTQGKGSAKSGVNNKTLGGKDGVAVMTAAASALVDDVVKQAGRGNKRVDSAIFKINED